MYVLGARSTAAAVTERWRVREQSVELSMRRHGGLPPGDRTAYVRAWEEAAREERACVSFTGRMKKKKPAKGGTGNLTYFLVGEKIRECTTCV